MKILLLLCLPFAAIAQDSTWSNESELSVVQTGGNTSLETYNLKTQISLKSDKRIYSAGGHYTLGAGEVEDQNDSTQKIKQETARNWDAHVKYEQVLSRKINGLFAVMYEGDEFSGYKQRENYDLGAKYKIHQEDEFTSFVELGLRLTTERTLVRNTDDKDVFNDNKGRVFYEFKKDSKTGLSYKFWTEYIKNFTRSDDYLINFEPSIAFTLSNTFSIKMAYKGMYDNEPAADGNEYMDWQYTTALLAKF
jgi:bisphosphoglycerate-independent phosphoglycerate mutase (AlkP superfamily)